MRTGETNRRLIVFVFGLTAGYLLANWNTSSQGTQDRSSIYDRQPAVDSLYSHDDDTNHKIPGLTKKYFIDCGANTASSVLLFSETYPGAKDYIIHSFEIDERLRPYFTPFKQDSNLVVHCPEGVAKYEGDQTAYLEGAWYPGKMNANKDMQWGGGTLFVSLEEREAEDGGNRKLSRRVKVPLVDLSQWIQLNTRKEDYVILKLDVEGAEYGILRKMLDDNTFEWIDKLYGEFHEWQPTEFGMEEKEILYDDMATAGVYMLKWAGENRIFEDFDRMHTSLIPQNTPGLEWDVINSCSDRLRRGVTTPVTIGIKIGMNAKAARRLVETIRAFRHFVPLTLFVYGDFVEQNPKLVKDWSDIYEIGIRAGSPLPQSYWQLQNDNILRMSIVSAEFRIQEIGVVPTYFLPDGFSESVVEVAASRRLRIINSTVTFPSETGASLTRESYFAFRDVERIPKALAFINDAIDGRGGIVSLDSDFPDSVMISVFLLDYLFDNSPYDVVSLRDCLR